MFFFLSKKQYMFDVQKMIYFVVYITIFESKDPQFLCVCVYHAVFSCVHRKHGQRCVYTVWTRIRDCLRHFHNAFGKYFRFDVHSHIHTLKMSQTEVSDRRLFSIKLFFGHSVFIEREFYIEQITVKWKTIWIANWKSKQYVAWEEQYRWK